ncbi:cullin-4A [Trichonephila clavipes]|nr:cullin-4A [Trichonephila clavipes]
MAVIQFNKDFRELLDVLNQAQVEVGANTERDFSQLDEERVSESKRHSLSESISTLRRPSGIVVSDADYSAVGTGRLVARPLERLVEGEERWEATDHPQDVLALNWGETEQNYSVTCMVFKATANDRRHLVLSHDEFRGLDLAFADQSPSGAKTVPYCDEQESKNISKLCPLIFSRLIRVATNGEFGHEAKPFNVMQSSSVMISWLESQFCRS